MKIAESLGKNKEFNISVLKAYINTFAEYEKVNENMNGKVVMMKLLKWFTNLSKTKQLSQICFSCYIQSVSEINILNNTDRSLDHTKTNWPLALVKSPGWTVFFFA